MKNPDFLIQVTKVDIYICKSKTLNNMILELRLNQTLLKSVENVANIKAM